MDSGKHRECRRDNNVKSKAMSQKGQIDMLGSWNIEEMKPCNLPQKAQSAFTEVTSGLMGADYMPVLYVGSQLVNGTNYCILAIRTFVTANPERKLVKVIIHEALDGKCTLSSVSGIAI